MPRNYAIDYMKFIAIYLVVCTHTIAFSGSAVTNQYMNTSLNNFPRFVIPFFFMVSGFLFGMKMLKVR